MILTSTSDIVRIITSSTADLHVQASWADITTTAFTPGRTNTIITSATTTTVVASPGASTQRQVKTLSIFNTHASDPNTITVQHYDGTTSVDVYEITLAAGERAQYNGEEWPSASTGTGVTDGDKGDITVASSGTSWTIDTPSSATVATDDKVLIKDTSASDVMKYVTAQSIRDLTKTSETFSSNLVIGGNSTASGYIDFLEDTDNGSNKVTLTAPQSIASDKTITLQDVTGTVIVTGGTDLTVPDGGTGVSSLTAYGVLCGGTTSTGAVQALAALGTAGAKLTSEGAGALPSFKGGNTAFQAVLANDQTISTTTETTILLDQLNFGTGSMMDVTTNKGRFTPTIAGTYLIIASCVYNQAFLAANFVNLKIKKNGTNSLFQAIATINSAATFNYNIALAVVSLNGSTDYITMTTYHDNASSRTVYGDAQSTGMSGVLIEAS